MDKRFILEKIRDFDTLNIKKSRDNFLSTYTYIKRRDIDSKGGWSKLYEEATGNRPLSHYKIPTEFLFKEYSRLQSVKNIFDTPLTLGEINDPINKSKYHGATFKARFKNLKNFFIEHKKYLDVTPKFKIPKRIFIGDAAEYLVLAELLFRNYHAQIISPDTGLDLIAYKNDNIYFFQVKHSEYKKKKQEIELTKSSYENYKRPNVFYVFVLSKKEKKDFLILPFLDLDNILNGQISTFNTKKIKCTIIHSNNSIYLNKISEDCEVSKYLNTKGWEILENFTS